MAVASRRVDVGHAAAELVLSKDAGGVSANVRNPTGSAVTVYLGGSDVSSANGYALAAGEAVSIELGPAEELYAICGGSDSVSLHVLEAEV